MTTKVHHRVRRFSAVVRIGLAGLTALGVLGATNLSGSPVPKADIWPSKPCWSFATSSRGLAWFVDVPKGP